MASEHRRSEVGAGVARPVEIMAIRAARHMQPGDTVFAGAATGGKSAVFAVGVPVVAALVARGVHGVDVRLQLGPTWDADVSSAAPLDRGEPFGDWRASAQLRASVGLDGFARGDIDLAFVTAAQVDMYGNLNTVAVTTETGRQVRLVGCVALTDHLACSKRAIALVPHTRRTFVPSVDFVSGVGFGQRRAEASLPGGGLLEIITDHATLRQGTDGRLVLHGVHPGVSVERVVGLTGFPIAVAKAVEVTEVTYEEVQFIRQVADPNRVWLTNEA